MSGSCDEERPRRWSAPLLFNLLEDVGAALFTVVTGCVLAGYCFGRAPPVGVLPMVRGVGVATDPWADWVLSCLDTVVKWSAGSAPGPRFGSPTVKVLGWGANSGCSGRMLAFFFNAEGKGTGSVSECCLFADRSCLGETLSWLSSVRTVATEPEDSGWARNNGFSTPAEMLSEKLVEGIASCCLGWVFSSAQSSVGSLGCSRRMRFVFLCSKSARNRKDGIL